jgi:hypothetical protein
VDRALRGAFDGLGDSPREVIQSCSEDEASLYRQ